MRNVSVFPWCVAALVACSDDVKPIVDARTVDAPLAFDAALASDAPLVVDARVDAAVDAPVAPRCGPPPSWCDVLVLDARACPDLSICRNIGCGQAASWDCCYCEGTPSGAQWRTLYTECFGPPCDAGP